jgi:predicted Zn-dependent peptidase
MIGLFAFTTLALEVARLSNGIPVILERRPSAETIAFCAMLRTDDLTVEETAWLEQIVASWYGGTEALTLTRLRNLAAQTGGRLTIQSTPDRLIFAAEAPKESFHLIVSVLSELWLHPDLREQAVVRGSAEREKVELFPDLPLERRLNGLAAKLGWRALTLPRSTDSTLQAAYARAFQPDRVAFALVGDIRSDEAVDRLNRSFGFWQNRAGSKPRAPGRRAIPREAVDAPFAGVRLVGPSVTSEDLVPFMIAVAALLEGKGSILGRRLRYERAESYQFGTMESVRQGRLEVILYASFDEAGDPDRTLNRNRVREAVEAMTEADVRRAKSLLASQLRFGRSLSLFGRSLPRGQREAADVAYWLCWWQLFGGSLDRAAHLLEQIDAVTLVQVRQAALSALEGDSD